MCVCLRACSSEEAKTELPHKVSAALTQALQKLDLSKRAQKEKEGQCVYVNSDYFLLLLNASCPNASKPQNFVLHKEGKYFRICMITFTFRRFRKLHVRGLKPKEMVAEKLETI